MAPETRQIVIGTIFLAVILITLQAGGFLNSLSDLQNGATCGDKVLELNGQTFNTLQEAENHIDSNTEVSFEQAEEELNLYENSTDGKVHYEIPCEAINQ